MGGKGGPWPVSAAISRSSRREVTDRNYHYLEASVLPHRQGSPQGTALVLKCAVERVPATGALHWVLAPPGTSAPLLDSLDKSL